MSNYNSQPNKPSNKNRKPSKDIVGSYFQDIIRIPLLSAEEEIFLAKQVQQRIHLLALKIPKAQLGFFRLNSRRNFRIRASS